MRPPLRPGLLVLHGNRLELLADALCAWLARHPLALLEEEVLLVQSNGMGEWLKMRLAAAHGVCAATRVELPARFAWRAYRAVLGRAVVPSVSALDKLPLTWRLMRLLPTLAAEPVFAPVAGFLGPQADALRRLQLARRLADLFDQYQVYRSHWLNDWARGQDLLRRHPQEPAAQVAPVPAEQAWQPALWRGLMAELGPLDRQTARPVLHQRFLDAMAAKPGRGDEAEPAWPGLPRRLVLFGSTHIPHQTLELVAALQAQVQVILAVPNPCRFHWADTIDGRELLTAPRRRHALRGPPDPATLPLHALHAHGHPLLAAWGRQARDFVRQLDAFDDAQAAQQRFALPRVDLFDEGNGDSLLQQVQARIRDLVPLAEHGPPPVLAEADRSIVFHVAHNVQREVEVLHDQLLHLLCAAPRDAAQPPPSAEAPAAALAPRDIVVMVPDIDAFAPAVRAVFGRFARGDPRHIPWGLADQRLRRHRPLLVALEWLLHAPIQRFTASALRDLLDVPAVARRLGLDPEALPVLLDWVAASGVRWGLHGAQRDTLGLGACGEANTWRFGLRRMLAGYAAGELSAGFDGIQPLAEVAGLDAGLAGVLAEFIDRLDAWWADAGQTHAPEAWAQRLRALLAALFEPVDDDDRALLAALDSALAHWLEACTLAGYAEPVPLAAVREAWLDAVDDPGAGGRFRAGGVTFCTLLPLRAIPFEVVCLLGMNDGDYPRRATRPAFDLMALPGQARPGDRSRRDDDRQLMLDALLSARRVLYLSWAGRSPRDNSAQAPSVLVGQLRDYLAAGWGEAALAQRTVHHPLQPFSRRYFEPGAAAHNGLLTYAAEWRQAHPVADADTPAPAAAAAARASGQPADAPAASTARRLATPGPTVSERPAPCTLQELEAFLRQPVTHFFRHRLGVVFDEVADPRQDDEPFAPQGLLRWQLLTDALALLPPLPAEPDEWAALLAQPGPVEAQVQASLAALRRAGRLPLGGPGRHTEQALTDALLPMRRAALQRMAALPLALPPLALRLSAPDDPHTLWLDDGLTGLRGAAGDNRLWRIDTVAKRLGHGGRGDKPPALRPNALLGPWLRSLAAAAMGQPLWSWLIGEDLCVRCAPPLPPDPAGVSMPPPPVAQVSQAQAQAQLADLVDALQQQRRGSTPWPTALATGLAWLSGQDAAARSAFEGGEKQRGERQQPAVARLYPDFDTLRREPGFEQACQRLYAGFADWLRQATDAQRMRADPGAADTHASRPNPAHG